MNESAQIGLVRSMVCSCGQDDCPRVQVVDRVFGQLRLERDQAVRRAEGYENVKAARDTLEMEAERRNLAIARWIDHGFDITEAYELLGIRT